MIADWSADSRVDKAYPLECYDQALRSLPEDLRAYSSAPDDIGKALLQRRAAQPLRMLSARTADRVAADSGSGVSAMTLAVPAVAGLLLLGVVGVWLVRAPRRESRGHDS